MYQFNPSLLEKTIIPDNTENAEAFLYEYTNLKNNMKYVGKRKGKPLEGYYHSSESEQFLNDFTDSNAKFKFEVLEYGSEKIMLAKEKIELKRVNAKDNDMYYNRSNGHADVSVIPESSSMMKIAQEILEHKRVTYEDIIIQRCKVKKSVLKGMKRLQTRRKTISHTHKRALQQDIMDKGGNTEHLTIVYLKDRKGQDIIIGGNHSDSAIQSCKKAVDAYVIPIPPEVHNNWSELSIKQLSGFLNPIRKNRNLESDHDDIEDMIFDLLVQGFTTDSTNVTEIYDYYNRNTIERTNISKKAKKRIKQQELDSLNWINYKDGDDLDKLEKRIEKENKVKGVYCKAYSTGVLSFWRDISSIENTNRSLIESKQIDKLIKVYKILLWHPNEDAELEHFKLHSSNDMEVLNKVFNRNGNDSKKSNPSPVQIIREYLPTQRMKEEV